MWLVPYDAFTIETDLDVDEAIDRIGRAIHPPQSSWSFGRRRAEGFEGTSRPWGYRINRIIGYRNSFLPFAYVRFEDAGDRRARVRVRLTLHPAVGVFSTIWIVMMGSGAVRALSGGSSIGFFVGAIAFLYLLAMLGWMFEVGRLRDFVRGVLSSSYRT
jgi:hypothetical protein